MAEKKKPYLGFCITVIASFALFCIMKAVQPSLPHVLFDYGTWDAGRQNGNFFYTLCWFLADSTEPHFQKTLFGGIGMLVCSFIAYGLDRKKSRLRGIPIGYGLGTRYLWVIAASMLALLISTLLYSRQGEGWIATFVPYVCAPAGVILLYGGGWVNMVTGAAIAGLLGCPVSTFIRDMFILPMGLPGVIGNVGSMAIISIFTFEICHYLPWMKVGEALPTESTPAKVDGELSVAELKEQKPNQFFIRRLIADFSEPVFAGNEWAGAGLLAGSILSWILNPDHTAYAAGVLPGIIFASLLTGAIALMVYWDEWMKNDWFPTFVPVVSAAPACVLAYGDSLGVIIVSAVIGALAGPPLALRINSHAPDYWHGVIGFVGSMAIITIVSGMVVILLQQAFPGVL